MQQICNDMYPHDTPYAQYPRRPRDVSLPPWPGYCGSADCLFTRWFTAALPLGSSGSHVVWDVWADEQCNRVQVQVAAIAFE